MRHATYAPRGTFYGVGLAGIPDELWHAKKKGWRLEQGTGNRMQNRSSRGSKGTEVTMSNVT